MNKLLILLLFTFLISESSFAQKVVPINYCISKEATEIAKAINEYRAKLSLENLEISLCLSYVAYIHAQDLKHNPIEDKNCNMHSWSKQGDWKPFCFPADLSRTNSPWNKPKELTEYPSRGYELIFYDNHGATAKDAITEWLSTPKATEMIASTGNWSKFPWRTCGIAVYEEYAIIWFGSAQDPLKPRFCK